MGRRARKEEIGRLLRGEPLARVLDVLSAMPAMEAANTLFSFLPSLEPRVKWWTVTGLGAVVARLADADMEQGRVILRRLMWQLNDESGGIGWGCPEAMGEILACHGPLAGEFAHVLLSYLREDANFLDYPPLQCGALWAVGRLAQVRPHLVQPAGAFLPAFLASPDPHQRGLAVWALGSIGDRAAKSLLAPLRADPAEFDLYLDREILRLRVMDMAARAMDQRS